MQLRFVFSSHVLTIPRILQYNVQSQFVFVKYIYRYYCSYVAVCSATGDVSRDAIRRGRFSIKAILKWGWSFQSICLNKEKRCMYTYTCKNVTENMKYNKQTGI